jgi:hypothetical protein
MKIMKQEKDLMNYVDSQFAEPNAKLKDLINVMV